MNFPLVHIVGVTSCHAFLALGTRDEQKCQRSNITCPSLEITFGFSFERGRNPEETSLSAA